MCLRYSVFADMLVCCVQEAGGLSLTLDPSPALAAPREGGRGQGIDRRMQQELGAADNSTTQLQVGCC